MSNNRVSETLKAIRYTLDNMSDSMTEEEILKSIKAKTDFTLFMVELERSDRELKKHFHNGTL